MKMNKRIIIEGGKVHNVGYRPFLLAKAWELEIPRYLARNIIENGMETVEVSIGGEERQVNEFAEFIRSSYPPKAKVLNVREAEAPERIMLIDKYDRVLAAEQQNTIVQTGLGMIGLQKETIGLQKQTIGLQKETIGLQKQTIGLQKETIGLQKQTVEKLDSFHRDTVQRFDNLDTKYGRISEVMERMAKSLEKLAENHAN